MNFSTEYPVVVIKLDEEDAMRGYRLRASDDGAFTVYKGPPWSSRLVGKGKVNTFNEKLIKKKAIEMIRTDRVIRRVKELPK